MKESSGLKSIFSLIFLYILVFQEFLQQHIKIFQWYDECLALMVIPMSIYYFIRNVKKFKMSDSMKKIIFLLVVFLIVVYLGNIFNYNRINIYIASDLLLNVKFFAVMFFAYMFYANSSTINSKAIIFFVKSITLIFFSLVLLNFRYDLFDNKDYRLGVQLISLFYTHSSTLAAICLFLVVILFSVYKNCKRPFIWIFMLLFITFFTMRFKALAAEIIFILIYVVVICNKEKLSFKHYLIALFCMLFVGFQQIQLYYINGIENTARGLLTKVSFEIANKFFPIGTGFANFASYMSGNHYSQVYHDFDLSTTWGLTQDNPSFISDTFWPMIIGQGGYLGLILYLLIVVSLYKSIVECYKIDKCIYLSSICILIYILIDSTAAAAFVSPNSIAFAFWLGIMFAKKDTIIYQNKYKENKIRMRDNK